MSDSREWRNAQIVVRKRSGREILGTKKNSKDEDQLIFKG